MIHKRPRVRRLWYCVIVTLASCGGGSISSSAAAGLLLQSFPTADVEVQGTRIDHDVSVVRAKVDGIDAAFVFAEYDTGWAIEGIRTADGNTPLEEWRSDHWIEQLLAPEEIRLGDYIAGQRPERSLRVTISALFVDEVSPEALRLGSMADPEGPAVVISGMNLDLLGLERGDPVELTSGRLVEKLDGWHPAPPEIDEGLLALLSDDERGYLGSLLFLNDQPLPYGDGLSGDP